MPSSKYLLNAFKQRNLVNFQESLEVYKVNPNDKVEINDDRTIFETILSTANSAEYIKLCLKNGADFYMVRNLLNQRVYNFLHALVKGCRIIMF